jgi:hypothetical protein
LSAPWTQLKVRWERREWGIGGSGARGRCTLTLGRLGLKVEESFSTATWALCGTVCVHISYRSALFVGEPQ